MSLQPALGDGRNVSLVFDHLRGAILHGELAPGDELSQVGLARHLGVSRTPLREALRMLISEGLVEAAPNRRLRVAGFSMADMAELYVERITLEAVAVRITTARLTRHDIAHMEGLLAEMDHFAAEDDHESWELCNRRLHEAFAGAAGRRVLDRLAQLSHYTERYRRAYTMGDARAWSAGRAQHRRIVDACKRRDADAAARALAEHLAHTALGVIAMVEPAYDASALRTAIAAAARSVEEHCP
jgi:DNA-binding GntR family transcriptional regulator